MGHSHSSAAGADTQALTDTTSQRYRKLKQPPPIWHTASSSSSSSSKKPPTDHVCLYPAIVRARSGITSTNALYPTLVATRNIDPTKDPHVVTKDLAYECRDYLFAIVAYTLEVPLTKREYTLEPLRTSSSGLSCCCRNDASQKSDELLKCENTATCIISEVLCTALNLGSELYHEWIGRAIVDAETKTSTRAVNADVSELLLLDKKPVIDWGEFFALYAGIITDIAASSGRCAKMFNTTRMTPDNIQFIGYVVNGAVCKVLDMHPCPKDPTFSPSNKFTILDETADTDLSDTSALLNDHLPDPYPGNNEEDDAAFEKFVVVTSAAAILRTILTHRTHDAKRYKPPV